MTVAYKIPASRLGPIIFLCHVVLSTMIFYWMYTYSMIKLMYEVSGSKILLYQGKEERLPLHYASGFGHLDIVKQLVEWDENRSTIEKPYKLSFEQPHVQFMSLDEQVKIRL